MFVLRPLPCLKEICNTNVSCIAILEPGFKFLETRNKKLETPPLDCFPRPHETPQPHAQDPTSFCPCFVSYGFQVSRNSKLETRNSALDCFTRPCTIPSPHSPLYTYIILAEHQCRVSSFEFQVSRNQKLLTKHDRRIAPQCHT